MIILMICIIQDLKQQTPNQHYHLNIKRSNLGHIDLLNITCVGTFYVGIEGEHGRLALSQLFNPHSWPVNLLQPEVI